MIPHDECRAGTGRKRSQRLRCYADQPILAPNLVRRIGGLSTAIAIGFGYPVAAAGCSQGGADVGGQRQTKSP